MLEHFFKLDSEQRCHRLRSEKMAFSWKMVGFQHKPDINPTIRGKNTNVAIVKQ